MMGRFGRSWVLVKVSFGIVRKDPELMVYPIFSAIMLVLVTLGLVLGLIFTNLLFTNFTIVIVAFVVLYFFSYFIMLFSNVALIGAADIRLRGGDPTLADGFRIAKKNLGAIIKWSFVSAFVGLVLRYIKEKFGIVGAITGAIVGVAWAMLTFFIVPVLIFEKKGVFESMKRSGSLFRQTWGETFIGHFALGLIFLVLALPGFAILILGFIWFSTNFVPLMVFVVAALIYLAIIAILSSAVNGVFIAALYRYTTTGKLGEDFRAYRGIFIPRTMYNHG